MNGLTSVEDPEQYLLAQVRESYGRVVYSQKTHEKQADITSRSIVGSKLLLRALRQSAQGRSLLRSCNFLPAPKSWA